MCGGAGTGMNGAQLEPSIPHIEKHIFLTNDFRARVGQSRRSSHGCGAIAECGFDFKVARHS